MNNLIYFLLIFLVAFLVTNPIFYKTMSSLYPAGYTNGVPTMSTSILLALVVSLLTVIISLLKQNQEKKDKENFFFEVSQPQPKCEKGYYGKNVNFDYTQPGNQICE